MYFLATFIASAALASAADGTTWSSGTPVCECPADNTYDISSFDECLTLAYTATPPCEEDVDAVAVVSSSVPEKDTEYSSIVVSRPATEYAALNTIKFTDKTTTPTCERVLLIDDAGRRANINTEIDEEDKSMTVEFEPIFNTIVRGKTLNISCNWYPQVIFASDDGLVQATFTYQREAPEITSTTTTTIEQSTQAFDGASLDLGLKSLIGAAAVYCSL